MKHHGISNINAHMRCPAGVVGALEENQIPRLGLGSGNNIADSHEAICRQASNTSAVAAVVNDPTDETRAVKAGAGTGATPDIGIT